MKLNINKMYVVYTISNYIENKQVKILGYIGYDRASQYKSLIESIAINEKFIDATGNTQEYLKNQMFYDCAVVENVNGEWNITNEHIILWDDIIDSERTQRLNENYTYQIKFNFKNFSSSDNITKEHVINTIENAIKTAYNTSIEKVGLEINEIYDTSYDTTSMRLQQTEDLLDKSINTLSSFISLETTAKQLVNDFTINDVNTKINKLGNQLSEIETNVNKVISQFK